MLFELILKAVCFYVTLIRAFIIKICRNLNKKVRLRQISCLELYFVSQTKWFSR